MFLNIYLIIATALGCFGFYKLYEEMHGKSRYDEIKNEAVYFIKNKKDEASQIIANANDKAAQIIAIANDEANMKSNAILESANSEVALIEDKLNDARIEFNSLNREVEILSKDSIVLVSGVNELSLLDGISSEQCKDKLFLLRQEEKDMISADKAVIVVNSSLGKKFVNNNIKQILRCFNLECDNYLINISAKNVDAVKSKIQKSFEILNKLYSTDGVQLSNDYFAKKLEEATLIFAYEEKKRLEREQQQAIKEQMIEEEKVRRELEAEKQKIEKDQKQFNNEINKLMMYVNKANDDVQKQLYVDKIKELELKVKELEEKKDNVVKREQNAKAGFVYVVSNIGSFGENVYKIGMTRRLQPMDRIKELSGASVPFEFDVHAMIFSEDAPKLEGILHEKFSDFRVNKVNLRKEFFRVPLQDIVDVVKEYNATVEFTMLAEAKEFKESVRNVKR